MLVFLVQSQMAEEILEEITKIDSFNDIKDPIDAANRLFQIMRIIKKFDCNLYSEFLTSKLKKLIS